MHGYNIMRQLRRRSTENPYIEEEILIGKFRFFVSQLKDVIKK
jgi:hypothetical protein